MIAALLPGCAGARSFIQTPLPISLVPVVDDTLVKHQLRALKSAGIKKLIVPWDSPELQGYFRTHHSEGIDVSFDVHPAAGPLIVLAGDVLPGGDLRAFLDYHAQSKAALTVAATPALHEPLGIWTVSPGIPEHSNPMLLSRGAQCNTRAEVFTLADDTTQIKTVADYLAATAIVLAKLKEADSRLSYSGDGVWADGAVFIAPGARITGSVFLGQNCSVASGATITGPVVLGEGTMICRNACIENSVLWAGAAVGSNARVTNSLVTECFTIGPGAIFDRCVGVDKDSRNSLPLQTASHIVQYSPRGPVVKNA